MSLHEKLVAIAQSISYIQKEGYNEAQSYKYVSEAQVNNVVRAKFLEQGILIIPNHRVVGVLVVNDKGGTVTTIESTWTITDGTDTIIVQTVGQGADRGDKGAFKAMTGSKKYAPLQLLLLATGDDPEETRDDERTQEASSTDDNKATTAQKNKLFAMGKEVGLEGENLRKFVYDTTSKNNSQSLTKEDMDKLFGALEVLKATGGKVVTP